MVGLGCSLGANQALDFEPWPCDSDRKAPNFREPNIWLSDFGPAHDLRRSDFAREHRMEELWPQYEGKMRKEGLNLGC